MTASTAALLAAEARFTEIYGEQGRRVNQYLYWHLPEGMRGRAEDLAQEVFIGLWEHLLKGREVTHPFALLKRIAQRRMADQFTVRARDTEAVLMDVTDPESPTVETVGCGSRYASGEPELALVAAELETAMERMREASAKWRDLHAKAGRYQGRAKPAGWVDPNPSRTTKLEAARVEVRRLRDEALVELQETCRVVGNLRAELERVGGGAWQSSGGWPPSHARDGRHRVCGALSDPTVKRCPDDHCLADVESVGFLEDGTRTCRACAIDRSRRSRGKAEAAR